MKSFTSWRFREMYGDLPDAVQPQARQPAVPSQGYSGGNFSLYLGKSEFLEFDSLSENPFDPLVQTGLAVQTGQESRARG